MPLSCSSIGTVISSSTSLEELPSAIVWISTCGGANSGKTSTFAFGIWATPNAISGRGGEEHQPAEPQAPADDPAHHRIPPASSVASRDLELGAVHLGGADRHDLRAGGRAVVQQRPAAVDAIHLHVLRGGRSGWRPRCRRTSSRRARRSAPRRERPRGRPAANGDRLERRALAPLGGEHRRAGAAAPAGRFEPGRLVSGDGGVLHLRAAGAGRASEQDGQGGRTATAAECRRRSRPCLQPLTPIRRRRRPPRRRVREA